MIYLDANVIIRLVQGEPAARAPIEARLSAVGQSSAYLMTSLLSRIECRCKPMATENTALLALYDQFLSAPELVVTPVSAEVIEFATELRARENFKTPDAIHMASAIVHGADCFRTADVQLARCKRVNVEVI